MATQRSKGEGSFERLPSGKWSCYVRAGKRKVRGAPADTKVEASINLQARLADEKKNGVSQANASLLTTLARRWIGAATLSPSTRDVYSWWLDSLERDELGAKKISDIKPADLSAWRDRLKLANSTVRNRCIWLNQILAASRCDHRVLLPPKKPHERRPLSPEERTILDNLQPPEPWMLDALTIARYLGLRRSEIFGLRHEDRDGNGVWVNRVVLLTRGRLIVREKGKTAKARSWVPLPQHLRTMIGNGRRGYVVGGQDNPMNPGLFSHWLYDAKKTSVLERVPYMGAHAIRRTYGMQLLESGVDLITAAEMMRHDPQMLANEYARSREDLKLSAVDKAFPPTQQTDPRAQMEPTA